MLFYYLVMLPLIFCYLRTSNPNGISLYAHIYLVLLWFFADLTSSLLVILCPSSDSWSTFNTALSPQLRCWVCQSLCPPEPSWKFDCIFVFSVHSSPCILYDRPWIRCSYIPFNLFGLFIPIWSYLNRDLHSLSIYFSTISRVKASSLTVKFSAVNPALVVLYRLPIILSRYLLRPHILFPATHSTNSLVNPWKFVTVTK